jgi:hypothetical protein
MEIAIAIGVVGTLAVIAAWHTALRGLGRRSDRPLLEELGCRVDTLARSATNEAETVSEFARMCASLDKRIDVLEKRLNDIAAHAAFRSSDPRQRRQA